MPRLTHLKQTTDFDSVHEFTAFRVGKQFGCHIAPKVKINSNILLYKNIYLKNAALRSGEIKHNSFFFIYHSKRTQC